MPAPPDGQGQDGSLGLGIGVVSPAPFLRLAELCLDPPPPPGRLADLKLPISLTQKPAGEGLHLSVRGVITSLPLLPRYS